jgi:MscS family membrane protein
VFRLEGMNNMCLATKRWMGLVLACMMRIVGRSRTTITRPIMVASFLSLILVLPVHQSAAKDAWKQEPKVAFDPYPLRPPDTSSPRATLRSFLTNLDKAIVDWRRGTPDKITDRAWMSAIQTLDFSTTPNSDSWSVQAERAILLKEILDRVEVPPYSKIPGGDAVAKAGVTRWTIPNTRITIARIEYGPRAGEFLFSAATVERLYRSYMIARELPYKPTASTPGAYEAYIRSDRTQSALERQLRMRLQQVNTSSPRSTLVSFLENVDRAWALVKEVDSALKAQPPAMSKQQALEIGKTANDLLLRAATTLDQSEIPAAYRRGISVEAVLKLKEVLDRTVPPILENVPDGAMVKAAWQEERQSTLCGKEDVVENMIPEK